MMNVGFIAKYTAKDIAKRLIHRFGPVGLNPLCVGIGSYSARYCYSVWLRHLVMARNNHLDPHPQVVAELGPGNSLGLGLAALLTGSTQYCGFDIVRFAGNERNVAVFDELVKLFAARMPIPDEEEFSAVKPYLDDYSFPSDILTDERLEVALDKSRVADIRRSLVDGDEKYIKYYVPWTEHIESGSIDMIISQAVLEHVDDLESAYKCMSLWLSPDGYLSHQIDFKCHGTADSWNGHWCHSDFEWKLIRKGAPFLINRQPHSVHLEMLRDHGFSIVCDKTVESTSEITIDDLAPRFRSMPAIDHKISGTFVQATL